MTQPLADQFPTLPFAAAADRFIPRQHETLHEQCVERRIRAFEFVPLLVSRGGLRLLEDGGGFLVVFNTDTLAADLPAVLGHEVAHTFHFDLSCCSPLLTVPHPNDMSEV